MNYQPSYQDFLYTDYIPSYSDSLAHHGIKGMHWGVRRYQNTDGSYTPEGKKHRGSSSTNSNKNSTKRKGLSENAKTRLKIAGITLGGAAAIAGASYLDSKYVGDPNAHVDYTNNAGKAETGTKTRKTPKVTRIPKDYWQQKAESNSNKQETPRQHRNTPKTNKQAKRLPKRRGIGLNDVEKAKDDFRRSKYITQDRQDLYESAQEKRNERFNNSSKYRKHYEKSADQTRSKREEYRRAKKNYEHRLKYNT